MADTKRQQGNDVNQEEPRNAPGSDRVSSGNQRTSQGGNRGEYQDTRNTPDENPEPGRRR